MQVEHLSPIGAEIRGAAIDDLLRDDSVPGQLLGLLEVRGVLVFPGLDLDDARQVALARRLGEPVVRDTPGYRGEHPEIFRVSLDRRINSSVYMKATFDWHIDGTTGGIPFPPKASLLTARALPAGGGRTHFASTYGAYERLTDEEKARFADLKVLHAVEASYRRAVDADPPEDVLAQLRADQNQLQPLVWTHRDGRRSLVIGSQAWYVEGMPRDEGVALLRELERRATEPPYVYTHEWRVGDLVIWDNRGLMHRAEPYDEDSGREMHRVTLVGDEPIQ